MRNIGRLVFSVLLGAFLFEALVRVHDWVKHGVPLASNATGVDDLRVIDSLGMHARPKAVFRKFKIDSRGFRGPEFSDDQLRERPVIVVSGSSESFGLYESEGQEWPRQLSEELASTCQDRAPIVLNAAFAGVTLPIATQDLAKRIAKYRPQIVVFYLQPTQYLFGSVPKPLPPSAVSREQADGWRSRSRDVVRDIGKRAVPKSVLTQLRMRQTERAQSSGQTPFTDVPVDRVDTLEVHLRAFIRSAREFGIKPLLIEPQNRFSDTTVVEEQQWLRAVEKLYPKASGSLLLRFHRLARTRIAEVARELDVPVLTPPLPEGIARARYFADANHFTDAGAKVVAQTVAAQLAQELGCRQALVTRSQDWE